MSSVPHLAGTEQDLDQAQWVHDRFVEFGLDRVKVVPYHVLLSYPEMDKPNIVYLKRNDEIVFNTTGKQTKLYADEEDSPFVAPNFNAYSGGKGPTESVRRFSYRRFEFVFDQTLLKFLLQTGLVYVHYGQESDYEYLARENIDVTGYIVLARYGKSFRGNIVGVLVVFNVVAIISSRNMQKYVFSFTGRLGSKEGGERRTTLLGSKGFRPKRTRRDLPRFLVDAGNGRSVWHCSFDQRRSFNSILSSHW